MIYKAAAAGRAPTRRTRRRRGRRRPRRLTVDGRDHPLPAPPRRARPLEGLRHPPRRPERLAAPRRGPARRSRAGRRRPRLDERHRGRRQTREGARARRRRPVHARVDRDRHSPGGATNRADRVGRSRDHPPCPQDRLPRPALPLHLADRALRLPRPPPAAGVDDPLAPAGIRAPRPARRRASSAGSSSSTAPRSRRATSTRSTRPR